jgi:hypothetical protein
MGRPYRLLQPAPYAIVQILELSTCFTRKGVNNMLGSRFLKTYLPALWIAMSAMVFASSPEEERKEPERDPSLAALRTIVEAAFSQPYKPLKEQDENNLKMLDSAKEALNKAVAAQGYPAIFQVPLTVLRYYLFPCFDPQTLLLGAGQTCLYFNQLSRLSPFYLDPDYLAERNAPNIALGRLRAATCSTQDGIINLASRMGVCAADLARWFEPAFLQATFQQYEDTLPPRLEGQSEEDIGRLYPIIKIALAASHGNVAHPLNPAIMPLLQEYPLPYGLSLNKLRLLSLNPARPGVYYETLEKMMHRLYGFSHTAASQERAVIARELFLRTGKSIATLNNTFLVLYGNAQQRRAAAQIIGWCIQNPQFCQGHDSVTLISNTLSLERPHLAAEILRKVIALPDNADTVPLKIQAFSDDKIREIEDRDIQSCIRQFSEGLYLYWEELNFHLKFQALSLLMQAERRPEVRERMREILHLIDDPLQCDNIISGAFYSSVCVFNNLCRYHYPEELGELTRRLFQVGTNKLLSIINLYNNTFTQLIKTDRERTIPFLKAFIECGRVEISEKLCALAALAEHAPEEKNYIILQVGSLNHGGNEEIGADADNTLMRLYYYLNDQKSCPFYYQKSLQKALRDEDPASIVNQEGLKKLQDAGLSVECIEDLLGYDPFKVLSILFARKD